MYRYTPIKHNVTEQLPAVREYLSGCAFVVAAYLFGSYRRGEENALSDIDIAVLFEEGAAPEAMREWESILFFELVQILRTDEIDLGNHIIAGYGLRRPETNSDIFLVLFDSGYIEDKRFAEKMVEMVKFSNLLTHFYMKVDMERVYAYLQNDLGVFEAFHRMVLGLFPSE